METTVTSRILVADDQPDILQALRLLLVDAGYETDLVGSVGDVIDRVSTQPYDLLLMDLNYTRDTTSGREGLELLDRVRAKDAALPVVVMTGWGSLVGDGYGDLFGEPWKTMPKDSGVIKVFALP